MSFYHVPAQILNPLLTRDLLSGSIVLPTDVDGQLEAQLRENGFNTITRATDITQHTDLTWWSTLPKFHWAVAITQGNTSTLDWILTPGYEMAEKGLIVLDRLSFLEPTRKRVDFLQDATLSNLIILNPRPEFRADQRKAKDSVTSAWYVFDRSDKNSGGTIIDFDVNWQRPKLFSKSERTSAVTA